MGEFVDDDAVYKYADFGFIGFDLWQVKAETIFDNIIITDDAAEADSFAEKWKALNEVETAAKKEEDEKKKKQRKQKKSRMMTMMMMRKMAMRKRTCNPYF